jgi:hypothetical protein
MKPLYKSTKVLLNAHLNEYQIYYRNWFFWQYDSCYKYDEGNTNRHYCDKDTAKERAITRAESMLETVEVWRCSKIISRVSVGHKWE